MEGEFLWASETHYFLNSAGVGTDNGLQCPVVGRFVNNITHERGNLLVSPCSSTFLPFR